ncbi:PxORF12 peptide [Anopheles sinensis]|uniref:PxORF12 peptide n=1 Tax=Anopheles sinensis TaxID=74873 RepID=A0A084WBM9_ANOSI|nr:PxORF12 peptide [Anopheles sinensis]
MKDSTEHLNGARLKRSPGWMLVSVTRKRHPSAVSDPFECGFKWPEALKRAAGIGD